MALSKITTESLLDGEITLPKLSSGTDGNIISYDASGNPVAIVTGNDGQVLTSTGAGSPPAFETPAGGGLILIGRTTASSSSEITVTGITSTYDIYLMILSDIIFSASANTRLRFGDSGGLDSGSSDYKYASWYNTSSDGSHHSTGDNSMRIDSAMNIGNGGTNSSLSGSYYFTTGNSGSYPKLWGSAVLYKEDGGMGETSIAGSRIATITVDRIGLVPSSGTITSGSLTVYGCVKS